ncbi:GNAT family N-acetyltransferase [Streptomyces cinnabarinus]|uniref:GNAT family N-acetyltransferase n=1 Tax=Streptomyces cinnabarinus TaxID=67287 RepID=A0ABY7K5I8_9ACTN|nr:GNAT family N-acetyltransferase [Streptomyces cinnabarinus]WAZ19757.1 GNAT family N-acetyltransferase [Streptomyces cinnabarinus]
MGRQVTVEVELVEGPAAARYEEAFRLIYAEAFAGPPYRVTAADVTDAFRHFPSLTARTGFRAALARTEDGEPAGMAYGSLFAPDTGWWDRLTERVPDGIRREDGHRSFGLMELAVLERWRGQGVARRLHERLLDGVGAERVLLNVHPESAAASAAYRAWGYRSIGRAHPWEDADPHDAMLLDLR